MISISQFSEKLKQQLKYLPGHEAQYKMATENRLPHKEWERYYADAKKGGVLILFYPHRSAIHTVLIQRPKYDGVHSGQVGFPGGAREKGDATMIDTALREAEEEIGVSRKKISVLGQLTELYIPPSNFLITPVIGYAPERPAFEIDKREVVELIEPSVNELMDESTRGVKQIHIRGSITIQAPTFNIQGRAVWGATAMMISELNEVLRNAV